MSCGVGHRHSLDLVLLGSDWTPSLGISMCRGCGPKKKTKKKKNLCFIWEAIGSPSNYIVIMGGDMIDWICITKGIVAFM